MISETELTWEEILKLADELVVEQTGKPMRDLEVAVLRGAWERKTYEAIAGEYHITFKHISDIGGGLWKKLSTSLAQPVSKTNFREALKREWQQRQVSPQYSLPLLEPTRQRIVEPCVEQSQIQFHCTEEISKPGALLRIKAPLQFGKTTLMSKIIQAARHQDYRTVVLNLRDAMPEDFSSLEQFLQWFITSIAQSLEQTHSIDDHWRKSLGNSKIKCRTYFEKYLLPGESPLVVAIDELDRLFGHHWIAGEFLGMLRTWHEDARTRPLWKQLRLIVLHSMVYTQVEINHSPFNAGTEVTLQEFSPQQVETLAQQYGLKWEANQLRSLMQLVGGHPYLIAQACRVVSQREMSLELLLQTAPTAVGIYRDHLEQLWRQLRSNQLDQAFSGVVATEAPAEYGVHLSIEETMKLHDIGLVKLQGQSVIPYCKLYRDYFSQRTSEG